jgi:carbonic anhydrase/acetyltransferase-like protein (isoleucine patch superfamily)
MRSVYTRVEDFISKLDSHFCIWSRYDDNSVWYGATLRGDVNKLMVGKNTSIGDRAVVHVAKIQGDFATHIGDNVTIRAGALIHAATLKDFCVIGEAAQVLDGSIVESYSIVAPASIVTPGTTVASGELWGGVPAKKVRALTEQEIAEILTTATKTNALATMHAFESSKDYKQVLEEEEAMDVEEFQYEGAPRAAVKDPSDVLGQGHPGRIFRSTLTHPEDAYKNESK